MKTASATNHPLPLPAEIDRLRAERDVLLAALLAIEPMLAGDSPLHVRYSRGIDQVRHAIARATPIDRLRAERDAQLNNPLISRWLIWSNEHSAWWGPLCCGYPDNIAAAGRYTIEQAVDICTQRSWMRGQIPPETMIHESSLPQLIAKVRP